MHMVQFKVSDWIGDGGYMKTLITTNKNRVLASTCMLHQPTVKDPNFREERERESWVRGTEFRRV
jgi:hypothetical protein